MDTDGIAYANLLNDPPPVVAPAPVAGRGANMANFDPDFLLDDRAGGATGRAAAKGAGRGGPAQQARQRDGSSQGGRSRRGSQGGRGRPDDRSSQGGRARRDDRSSQGGRQQSQRAQGNQMSQNSKRDKSVLVDGEMSRTIQMVTQNERSFVDKFNIGDWVQVLPEGEPQPFSEKVRDTNPTEIKVGASWYPRSRVVPLIRRFEVINKAIKVRSHPEYPGVKLGKSYQVGQVLESLAEERVKLPPRHQDDTGEKAIIFHMVAQNEWLLDYSPGAGKQLLYPVQPEMPKVFEELLEADQRRARQRRDTSQEAPPLDTDIPSFVSHRNLGEGGFPEGRAGGPAPSQQNSVDRQRRRSLSYDEDWGRAEALEFRPFRRYIMRHYNFLDRDESREIFDRFSDDQTKRLDMRQFRSQIPDDPGQAEAYLRGLVGKGAPGPNHQTPQGDVGGGGQNGQQQVAKYTPAVLIERMTENVFQPLREVTKLKNEIDETRRAQFLDLDENLDRIASAGVNGPLLCQVLDESKASLVASLQTVMAAQDKLFMAKGAMGKGAAGPTSGGGGQQADGDMRMAMSQMLEGVRSCWTLATEGNLPHGSELTKMEQLLQDPNSNSGDLLKAARDVAGCCKESLSEEVSRIQRKNTIDRPDNGWRKKIEDKLLAVQEKNRNLREELNFERKRRASVANSAPMAQTADLEGESAPLGKGSARPAGKGAGGPGHRRSRTAYSVSAPVFPEVEREDLKFQVKVRDKRIAELREEVEQIARTSATSTEITKLLSQVARQKKEIRDLKDAVHNQDDDNVSVATSGGLYLRWESLQSITEAFHAQHCRLLREAQRRTPSIPYYENYHRGLPFERVQILGDFITRYINDPCGPYEGPRREAPPSEHGTRSRKSVDTRGCGQQQDPKLYGGLIKGDHHLLEPTTRGYHPTAPPPRSSHAGTSHSPYVLSTAPASTTTCSDR